MTIDPQNSFDVAGFQEELARAGGALQSFARGPVDATAERIGVSFERAGERITRALAGAALGGEASFKRLAKVVLEELAKIAMQRIFTQGAGGKMPFFGGKAAGGPVNVGGAYLVGERGPEVFVPRQGGEIAGVNAGAVNVHFHLAGGADGASIVRHQGQIAAAIARAVAYGRRNL